MIEIPYACGDRDRQGRGRNALLSFSAHTLVKAALGPVRGGDINCLTGDIISRATWRLFRAAGRVLSRPKLYRQAGSPDHGRRSLPAPARRARPRRSRAPDG